MATIEQFIPVSPNRMQCKCGEIMRDYQTEDHQCITSIEAEQAYKAKQGEADALRQAWHDALIAECGFEVGDRVLIIVSGLHGTIVDFIVFYARDEPKVVAVAIYEDKLSRVIHIGSLQRIDEYGKPLPPREKGEA